MAGTGMNEVFEFTAYKREIRKKSLMAAALGPLSFQGGKKMSP